MYISQDDPEFRPITIRLETQDDYDKFDAIVRAVAENKINHVKSVVDAAKEMLKALCNVELTD